MSEPGCRPVPRAGHGGRRSFTLFSRRRYLRCLLLGLRGAAGLFFGAIALALLLAMLYQVKRALGIDIFPDQHVEDFFPFLRRLKDLR